MAHTAPHTRKGTNMDRTRTYAAKQQTLSRRNARHLKRGSMSLTRNGHERTGR